MTQEQGSCCHWELMGKERQNEKTLGEAGLLHIRNTSVMVGGGERATVSCMKYSLSKSHTALFEDAVFSQYFN